MTSDQELVAQSLSGDVGAAAELIRRYESAVFAIALGISADHHAAEDVTQDAFVTAISQLSTLKNPERFGGWLLTIAKRMALRTRARRKRVSSLESVAEISESNEVRGQYSFPEDIDLMAQVARLPDHEQIIIALKNFQGLSVNEIARITGRPVGTVTKQLSRAYARLRKRLTENEK